MFSTFYSGDWYQGKGETLTSTTPDESEIVWQKEQSSCLQVEEAVESARLAQLEWGALSIDQRLVYLKNFANKLEENKESFSTLIHLETGKPQWEALTEVTAMINKVDISLRAYHDRTGSKEIGSRALNHRPHGVMAVFGPYNFPGHLPNGHIVPALLAGNTVVFKPSELTPRTGEQIIKFWEEAGIPGGVVNLVQGNASIGKALVNSNINGVLFTGSYLTGKKIHKQLAERPEVLLALEMGGNNPLIVGDIESPEIAAHTILQSAFLTAGQRCTCARRLIIVDSDKSEQTLTILQELIDRLILGKDQVNAFMGPVISKKAAQELLEAQEKLVDRGAKVIAKMAPVEQNQVYLRPGILDVSTLEAVEDQEYFGPLLQVWKANSFKEAVRLANNTCYGLSAGLLSDNKQEQEQFLNSIKAGIVSINAPTAGASSELPFGGVGASGNHRPSAYYAADYCAWPQATMVAEKTGEQAKSFDFDNVRGIR